MGAQRSGTLFEAAAQLSVTAQQQSQLQAGGSILILNDRADWSKLGIAVGIGGVTQPGCR